MTKKEHNISDAEMVIMRVVWSLKRAKVTDVMQQIRERQDWSLATVKTLLGRLVKKNFLVTEKEGRSFVYQAAVGESEIIKFLAADTIEKVCEKKHAQVISNHIGMAKLTESDLELLIRELSEKEAVESIHCTCLDQGCQCCQDK